VSYESQVEPIKLGYVFDSGYLVARRLDPDGLSAHIVDRFGQL
jgi:hypothetical protein